MFELAGLNPAQKEAVTTWEGPLLVLAGAGTGKTRVITYRIVELIRRGISPERILSVTFTNKAAREMKERTTSLLKKKISKQPSISTFHAFCVRILREDISNLGYPQSFSIADRGDQESLARQALRDIKLGDKAMQPGDLISNISRWKMKAVAPQQARHVAESDLEFLAALAYRKYQSLLKASGSVDFDDLLVLTLDLFRNHPQLLSKHQNRFDRVQIDEYQDTNNAQFEIVQHLVEQSQNLCVVGDDDQAIYAWRGAEVTHILNFQQHYPNAKVIRLEENYRCTRQILDLANELMKHNITRHEKTLWSKKTSEKDVRFLAYSDEQIEAENVVGEIKYLTEIEKVRPSDIAVLFRTNEQPRIFESEFRRQEVCYVLLGGQSFFNRREVRDMLAYLKVFANPFDQNSLLRIVNYPPRGIGASSVEKLLKRSVGGKKRIFDVATAARDQNEISAKTYSSLMAFRGLIDVYRQKITKQPQNLSAYFAQFLEEIHYEHEISRQYKSPDQQQIRKEMVQEFLQTISQYQARSHHPSIRDFLQETALTGRDDEFAHDSPVEESAVRLMTYHSAKGLEFPLVYMVGMEEGLLPHRRAVEESEKSIDEERRLAYVGMTRAMESLTLTRAESRTKWGKRRPTIPSRFLFEIRGEEDIDSTDNRPDLLAEFR